MDNIISMDSLFLYKEAAKRLEKSDISYEKSKLLNNPELCNEIIELLDYFQEDEQ